MYTKYYHKRMTYRKNEYNVKHYVPLRKKVVFSALLVQHCDM